MNLNQKISQLRNDNNWSQEELAEKLNVSRQSVSK
ncbi:helix-turn-helix transcriptional regulator [Lactobacillus amylovorus]